jgi:histidinol-phosphate/aromatic aminotransferase/cobyric acid decarboxylase-like protein
MTGWERLGDPGHAAQVRARTLRARAELTRPFEHAGYPVIPAQANFILVQAPDEHALVSRLAEHAIAVRPGIALVTSMLFSVILMR